MITLRSDGWDWGTGVDSAKTHTLQSNEVRSIPDCGLSRRKQHTHWNLGRFLEVTLFMDSTRSAKYSGVRRAGRGSPEDGPASCAESSCVSQRAIGTRRVVPSQLVEIVVHVVYMYDCVTMCYRISLSVSVSE